MLTANQNTEHIAATEAEPIATDSDDARPAMPHDMHRCSTAQTHLFQAADVLCTPHKLVNLSVLAR